MAEIIETVPFNFDDTYKGIEDLFAEKGYDIEEGSNTAQLITAMAYISSMLNVNTAVGATTDLGLYPNCFARATTLSLKVAESMNSSLTTILVLNAV